MTTNGETTIEIGGKSHRVTLPGFAEREDVWMGYFEEEKRPRRRRRVLAAGLALCCPTLNAGTSADYAALDFDVVKFGHAAYNAIRSQGHSIEEVQRAGIEAYNLLAASVFPRENEVDEKEGFTEAGEVAAT